MALEQEVRNRERNKLEIKNHAVIFSQRNFIFQKLKEGLSFAFQQTFNKCISTINILLTTNLMCEQHPTFGK